MSDKVLAAEGHSAFNGPGKLAKAAKQYGGILAGLVALVILFSVINDSFLSVNNITNIILQVSIIAITAYGMTYVLLLGISIFRWGQPLHWWGPLLRLACRLASRLFW
ncbi:ribose ABC transporter permease protein [Serratia fonticola]|uniref:Ribose ABC transporter permease protein n=1 Tax=Serratia fonticola TaxID=47917 RepID=A0A3S4YFV0_SERFO|nr:ribose ABC transporter permease protein [Serratia fonticola]